MLDPRPDRIKLLVEALRSKKYVQTFGRLRDSTLDNCFCMEGLACHIFQQKTTTGNWLDNKYFMVNGIAGQDYAPQPVREWFGIPFVIRDKPEAAKKSFLYLNDDLKLPFSQFADLLEKEYLCPRK